MSNRRRVYLICYDIADPRRLGRVARFMVKRAWRVQYSVYVAELRPSRLDALLDQLADLINPREDDVRAYPLPGRGEVSLMGTQMFPPGIMLIRDGQNVFRLGAEGSEGEAATGEDAADTGTGEQAP